MKKIDFFSSITLKIKMFQPKKWIIFFFYMPWGRGGGGGEGIKNIEKTIFRKISAEMEFFEVQF